MRDDEGCAVAPSLAVLVLRVGQWDIVPVTFPTLSTPHLTEIDMCEGVRHERIETRLVDLDVEDAATVAGDKNVLVIRLGQRLSGIDDDRAVHAVRDVHSTGFVPQWYMKTPGSLAVKRKLNDSPGMTSLNALFGAMRAAWKSIECGMAPPFFNVISTVWPWRTWMIGPGAP
jgi:hypothetical protein